MSSNSNVITRFAPSPTGYLHVGGARTALYNYLLSKHFGGTYLLRIEDTDLARSTEQAAAQLLDDLKWLGLHHNNADSLVYQSKRLAEYNRVIDDLTSRNLAYKAYDTREEVAAMRKSAEKEKRQFVYRRRSDVTPDQIARWESEGRPHVVRFAMPVKEYSFNDEVLGEITLPAAEAQDFVIRKADGMPTYHFAVVIDDFAMKITHVLRAQEHTKNTFNHIALMEALGYPRPKFAHLTTIQNPDGSKMGKRDRDKVIRQRTNEFIKNTKQTSDQLSSACGLAKERFDTWLKDSKQQLDFDEQESLMRAVGMKSSELPEILIHDFRKNGYLPEALLNFLALLGWSPGGNKEAMSMSEMIELFTLDRVGKSNPKFDRAKLISFNTEAAAAASPDRLLAAFKDYLDANPDAPQRAASEDQLLKLLSMKKGFRTLREVDEPTRFLFLADDAIVYDAQAVEKTLKKNDNEGATVLRDLRPILADVSSWTHDAIESPVKAFGESRGLGLGKIAQPLRIAVSGSTISPPIFESLEFLGKAHTLARIDRCLREVAT